jgi:hypothetical protein
MAILRNNVPFYVPLSPSVLTAYRYVASCRYAPVRKTAYRLTLSSGLLLGAADRHGECLDLRAHGQAEVCPLVARWLDHAMLGDCRLCPALDLSELQLRGGCPGIDRAARRVRVAQARGMLEHHASRAHRLLPAPIQHHARTRISADQIEAVDPRAWLVMRLPGSQPAKV